MGASLLLLVSVLVGGSWCQEDNIALGREFRAALQKYHIESKTDYDTLGSSSDAVEAVLKDRMERFENYKKFRRIVDEINTDSSVQFTAEMNFFSVEKNRPGEFGGLNMGSNEEDFDEDYFDEEWGDDGMGDLGSGDSLPDHVDFRADLTPVQHQGRCGSCWAYSSVATAEWSYYMATGLKKKFSEQTVLECGSGPFAGCKGRDIDAGIHFVFEGYLPLAKDNPYVGVDRHCSKHYPNAFLNVKFRFKNRIRNDDFSLLKAAAKGVLMVGMHGAQNEQFKSYKEGIYYYPARLPINHAVNLVGYGADKGRKYWLIRNSWGDWWGEDGYFKMSRDHQNTCGINLSARFVKLDCIDQEVCDKQKQKNEIEKRENEKREMERREKEKRDKERREMEKREKEKREKEKREEEKREEEKREKERREKERRENEKREACRGVWT